MEGLQGATDGVVGSVVNLVSVVCMSKLVKRLLFQARRLGASGGAELVCCFNVRPITNKPLTTRLQLLVGPPLDSLGGDVLEPVGRDGDGRLLKRTPQVVV